MVKVIRYLSVDVGFEIIEDVKVIYAPRPSAERRNGCSRSCTHLPIAKSFHPVHVFLRLLVTLLFPLWNAHAFESFDAKT